MKGLKEVLANVGALKRDIEELGAELKVSVSIEMPLENLEKAEE